MCLWMRSPLCGVLGHPLRQFPQRKWPHKSASFSLPLTLGILPTSCSFFFNFFLMKCTLASTRIFCVIGLPGAAEHHLQSAPATGEQGARHRAQREPVQEKWWVSGWTSSQCLSGQAFSFSFMTWKLKNVIQINWLTEGQQQCEDSNFFLSADSGKCGRRGSARWRTATWPSLTGR